MSRFKRSNPSTNEFYNGQHRFEHWYRDNTVYFITARCSDRFSSLASEEAKNIFWDRFNHYTQLHSFECWVTTLLDNHYHTLGYLRKGKELAELMRKLHGSVAKLVNDTLPERRVPFWRDDDHNDYFDGCIRDALQLDRAYRYTHDQAVRAKIVTDYRDYPHTHLNVELTNALEEAARLHVYLSDVPYQRYDRKRNRRKH